MRKVLQYSFSGLLVSQFLPGMVGEKIDSIKAFTNVLLYICLGFIMINVGREFEMDKSKWKSYAEDYFIAMAYSSNAMDYDRPFITFLCYSLQSCGLIGRLGKRISIAKSFCSPYFSRDSFHNAGGDGLKSSWIYKKIQVSFRDIHDLDTILP
ncbi:hypothetical protein MASR1M31_12550 [Porphyromonadaceae bacterium]